MHRSVKSRPLGVQVFSQPRIIVHLHNLQRSLKETPWDLCGFLLTQHCELMGCWWKTNIGIENIRSASHKSSLLTVYDIDLKWPDTAPTILASQNWQAFWDFVHPVRACLALSLHLSSQHHSENQLWSLETIAHFSSISWPIFLPISLSQSTCRPTSGLCQITHGLQVSNRAYG